MNSYTYEEITVGMSESFDVTIDEAMMQSFKTLSGDDNPLHVNDEYAIKKGHSSRVVYGMLTASFFSRLAGVYLPGEHCLLHGIDSKFNKPVYIGDQLSICGVVAQKSDNFKMIVIKATIKNQRQELVCTGLIKAGVI